MKYKQYSEIVNELGVILFEIHTFMKIMKIDNYHIRISHMKDNIIFFWSVEYGGEFENWEILDSNIRSYFTRLGRDRGLIILRD